MLHKWRKHFIEVHALFLCSPFLPSMHHALLKKVSFIHSTTPLCSRVCLTMWCLRIPSFLQLIELIPTEFHVTVNSQAFDLSFCQLLNHNFPLLKLPKDIIMMFQDKHTQTFLE